MNKQFFRDTSSAFAFYGIVFIPFPFTLFKYQLYITDFVFGPQIKFTANSLFGIQLSETKVYSDFVSMYILVLLLALLAIITALVLAFVKGWGGYRQQCYAFIRAIVVCYLSLQLLKYGADKVFKNQFYLPEPNILYTPLGHVNKDLLYWSSMGTSHFYSVFLGIAEAVAAVMIFFRRTRIAGLLIAFFIMLNVTAINFAFDISVKLYSLFLLFLIMYLLAPQFSSLYSFFFAGRASSLRENNQGLTILKKPFSYGFIKWLIAGFICLEVFYPYIKSGNFNGDTVKRPYLHGAYRVVQPHSGIDTLGTPLKAKMFFIHKDGYIIFQNTDDVMKDFKLQYDTLNKAFLLTDYQKRQTKISYNYSPGDSTLSLRFSEGEKEYNIAGKAVDWRKLPALDKGFHWTVD